MSPQHKLLSQIEKELGVIKKGLSKCTNPDMKATITLSYTGIKMDTWDWIIDNISYPHNAHLVELTSNVNVYLLLN